MVKEVMNLIDECTGEMQCKVCGSVHIAKREHDGKFPPESLWCIHGCRFEDIDQPDLEMLPERGIPTHKKKQ